MNIKHKLNILDNILTESRQSNIKIHGSNIDGYLLARSRNKYVKISVCYKRKNIYIHRRLQVSTKTRSIIYYITMWTDHRNWRQKLNILQVYYDHELNLLYEN